MAPPRKGRKTPSALGRAITRLRTRADLQMVDLARRANISPSYISQLESGERQNASWQMLASIAKALGITPDDLYAEAGMIGDRQAPQQPVDPEREIRRLMDLAVAALPERIPVQESWVHAGIEGIDGQFVYRLPEWHGRRIVVFVVRGRCMEPEIEPGDRVIVDLDQAPEDGDIVVVDVDGEVVVRRYDARRGELAANDGSAPIPYDRTRTVATVIEVTKRLRRGKRRFG